MKQLNIGYMMSCFKSMDKKVMLRKARIISRNIHKPLFFVLSDIAFCAVRYGSGYMDYYLFEMYNMTNRQRDTLVTRRRNNQLVRQYNNPDYMHFFENKNEFNAMFSKYLNREWVDVTKNSKADVINFIKRHKTFMVKPVNTCCGQGIKKIKLPESLNLSDIENFYEKLISSEYHYIIEEVIQQHPLLNKMCPTSINTARVVTLIKNEKVNIICAFFRIGNGKCVDNFNNGGMLVRADEKNGILISDAVNKNKEVFKNHPITNTKIKGFTLPDWEKVRELCISASQVLPQIKYVAWDICFTPDGPYIVEGNEYPGYDIYQIPEHIPDKKGLWERFK